MVDYSSYESSILEMLETGRAKISSLKPSEWAEQNIIMPKPFPGALKYSLTPYTREIIDCLAQDHPAREIAVMGAAQWGKTASILVPAIGYIIANDPGNIIMTVGHEDLIAEAMDKVDAMIDGAGLRSLIKPNSNRAKSQKTGDTNTKKEFPNGYLKLSSASNPKIWRQVDYKFGLIDDYEAVKGRSKTAGSTRDLIEKRFTAYDKTKKIFYISSPEREQNSNILEVYKLGDQRKYLIPCPCCGSYIELRWSVVGKNEETCGITWQVNEDGSLITESVGYKCQDCLGFFTDQYKADWVGLGFWKPTAKPFKPEFYSYHMSSLYSPHGMSDWLHYVYKWIECHPPGGSRIEDKYQSFLNIDLGEPYSETAEAPKANELQKNIRGYEIGTIPEKLSIADGNGSICLLTCACDLNGTLEDARLDWEIKGWSEQGTSYSIDQGSIGTFVPKENSKAIKADREKWTYEHHRAKSVWPEFTKIVDKIYETDTGRKMKIYLTGVDTGHYTVQAYAFVDAANNYQRQIICLKGDKENKYIQFGVDVPSFKIGRERNDLYMVQVGKVKDELAACMKLKHDERNDGAQPPGFINFPQPAEGKYSYQNYFAHFESEHRVIESKDGVSIAARWEKKSSASQNHFWDICVYNMTLRDIVVYMICKDMKIKNFGWKDYLDVIFRRV